MSTLPSPENTNLNQVNTQSSNMSNFASSNAMITADLYDNMINPPQPLLPSNKIYNTYMLMITVGLSILYALAICLRLFINCCRKYHDKLQQQEKRKLRSSWARKMKIFKARQKTCPRLVKFPAKTLHLGNQVPPCQQQPIGQRHNSTPISHHSSISSLTLKNTTASPSSIEQPSKPLIRTDFLKDLFHHAHSNLDKPLEGGIAEDDEEDRHDKSYCSLNLATLAPPQNEHTSLINSNQHQQKQHKVLKLPLDLLDISDLQQQDNRSAKADFTRKFRLKSKRIHGLSKAKQLDLLWQWSISKGYCEYTHAVALNELAQRLLLQQQQKSTEMSQA